VSPLVELTLAVLLATGAVYFVLRPIFRVTASVVEGDEGDESEEDLSPRAVALRALKEIEFDRATGKLSDADYDALKNQYTGMALDALREAGPSHAFPHPASPIPPPASPIPPPTSPIPHSSCPIHGPSSEIGARFCPECGRRLSAAHGFCARCGAALESGAHYCNACGARVAA